MNQRIALVFMAFMLSMGSPVVAQPNMLYRWSVAQGVAFESVMMDKQGVIVRVVGKDLPITVPWFDVRDLSPLPQEYASWKQINQDAWRAHARLVRGDSPGAAQLYEELKEEYLWKIGPESVDVAVGLARTRIEQGDRVGAIEPFLSWTIALGSNNFETWTPAQGFDAQYGVMIDLPPVFLAGDGEKKPGEVPQQYASHPRAKIFNAFYQIAFTHRAAQAPSAPSGVKAQLAQVTRLIRDQDRRDPGLLLFQEMASAMYHPDAQRRAASRLTLDRRKRVNTGTWIEVWARLAIGLSLIAEPDVQSNELGVIELIHIVVRLPYVSQSLTEFASQEINHYLTNTNREHWGNDLLLYARENAQSIQQFNAKEATVHE